MSRRLRNLKRCGTSLVETLVVVGIVAMLAALSTVVVSAGIRFAHDIEARANWAKKHARQPRPNSIGTRGHPIADQYIVVLTDNSDVQQEIGRLSQKTPMHLIATWSLAFKGFAAQLPASAVPALLTDPAVRYVEQDQTLALASVSTNPDAQVVSTGLRRVNAAASTSMVDADVAIIDTGVDLSNNDLNVVMRKGFNYGDDAKDTDGHGTQVACIAAALFNDFGVIGVAPGARVWAMKVAAEDNTGSASGLISALEYVMSHADEIDVANISVTTTNLSVALNTAAASCVRAGVTVVAAAGNGDKNACTCSPGSEPSAITVGALTDTDGKLGGKGATTYSGGPDDTLASFSNFGPVVDFLAPGVLIDTLELANERSKATGTSFAAAHVSGLVAMFSHQASRSATPFAAHDVAAALASLVKERIPGRGRLNPYPVITSGQAGSPVQATAATLKAPSGLPIPFEPNVGQTDPSVRYLAHSQGFTAFLTAQGVVLGNKKMPAQRVQFANANPNPTVYGQGTMPGVVNYFIGNDPSRWRTNIPTYGRVIYDDMYPGIDLLFHSDGGQFRYDIIVAPGADPSLITLDFPDALAVKVERAGSLQILLPGPISSLCQSPPVLFQNGPYGPQAVRGRLVAVGPKQVRFEIGDYDPTRELIIDPVIFSTFLGGNGSDEIFSMAEDGAGNIYVGGSTTSSTFPVIGAFDSTIAGQDCFVTKINAAGTAILYSTFLGGTASDGPTFGGLGIAVNNVGEVAIASETSSNDFPVVAPFQPKIIFFNDGFVTKLNAAGNALIFSTYLGSNGFDFANAAAFDAAGNVYVAGNSTDGLFPPLFPTTPGAFQTKYAGGGLKGDPYAAKFTPAGALVYCTYVGGSADEECYAISVVGGNAYIAGFTSAANFPTTPGAFQTKVGGGQDMFVAQINPTGSALVYCTYLGGTGTDGRGVFPFGGPLGLTTDAAGNAYVASASDSPNYPVTPGVVQTTLKGNMDVVITKIDPTGASLLFSTYLGGTNDEIAYAVALDLAGNIYIAGDTNSANYPLVNPVQPYVGPFNNVLVSVLNPTASMVSFSTVVGKGIDTGRGVAPDGLGNVWVAGNGGGGFPQVNPLLVLAGGHAFVAKIAPSFAGVTVTQSGGTTNVAEGGATDTYTIALTSAPTANVTITLNPGAQLSVAPAVLTFTPANFNVPQTVTVTAIDDFVVEGPHTGTITHTAASADPIYNGFVIASVTANITDNDTAGVVITESGGTTNVTEGGATDTYTVVLKSSPASPVTITMNPGTQVTVAPPTLTFTPANWNVAQTVTVTAVDDVVIEGPHTGAITHAVTSADPIYNGIPAANVVANITDNDFPIGVTITQSGGTTTVTEGGATDTYTAVLISAPTANVTITINPGAFLTVAPVTLTFTPANWNTAQTVTVTAIDDSIINPNPHAGVITHTAASADLKYNGIAIANVVVTIFENDFPPVDAADTSDTATPLGVLKSNKVFNGLDTVRHPNGMFDDDWYSVDMSKSGVFTVDLKTTAVFCCGPKGQFSFGALAFRIYRVVNGTLVEIGSSQGAPTNTVSAAVNANERIYVWIYGIYFTQAQYDFTIDLK